MWPKFYKSVSLYTGPLEHSANQADLPQVHPKINMNVYW